MRSTTRKWLRWPQVSMGSSFLFVGAGLGVEMLVILSHMMIQYCQENRIYILGVKYTRLYSANATIGLLGTLILAYGIICLLRGLRVSRHATAWGYAGIAEIGSKLH